MEIKDFEKIFEFEYIINRINELKKEVESGNYERAIDYLRMIESKASYAISQLEAEK